MDLVKIVKIAKYYDSTGQYKKADDIFYKLSSYYPEQSITKQKDIQLFEWDEVVDEQFKENDTNYITKKPNLRVPEYFDLGGEKDGKNIEGLLNGPDSVPGPAYIDPGNLASSPSMAGDLDYFLWDEVRNEDHPEYNRIPRR